MSPVTVSNGKQEQMSGERRVFVLDTNVLLSFGVQALHAFEDAEVVVPLIVVSELEKFRFEIGLEDTARQVLRELNKIVTAETKPGDPVRVEMNHIDESKLDKSIISTLQTNDARILAVAYNLKNEGEGRNVTLVTEDTVLSLAAKSSGVPTEGFRPGKRAYSGYHSGVTTIEVEREFVDKFYKTKVVSIKETDERVKGVVNNSFVVFSQGPGGGGGARAFATKHPDSDEFRFDLVDPSREPEAFGLKATAQNKEQVFALQMLMDPEIKVVSLGGKAGTGKTLLALMAGLDHVMEQPNSGHEKITVFRPVHAVGGQDLGYLPGSAEEKMEPWAQAVWDAIESEVSTEVIEEIKSRGYLEVQPLTHIRGRSLHKRWIIIDEAQNLDLPSILAVLTRTGKNTKVILNWDESQRDNPHVSRYNGIVEAVNRMHGHPLFGHVTLVKSERSPVAAMAGALLDN